MKTIVKLLVVMSPMRRVWPAATCAAAWCHQNITKSALSGTSGQAPRNASKAQLVVEFFDFGAGLGQFGFCRLALQRGGFVGQHQGGGLGVGPICAQGLDQNASLE